MVSSKCSITFYNLNRIWPTIFQHFSKKTRLVTGDDEPSTLRPVSWESRRLGQRTSNKVSDFSLTHGDTNNKLSLEDGVKHHVSTMQPMVLEYAHQHLPEENHPVM